MNILSTFVNALFLREDAYVRMRDMNKALVTGLVLIVVLALVISVLALIGEVVEVAVGPDIGRIKQVVWNGLMNSSLLRGLSPEELAITKQQYEMGWSLAPVFGAPDPLSKAFDLIARPVIFLADWFIYGIIAFVLAKFVFKGEGQFTAFLGTLALAATPQALHLLQLLPGAEVDGTLINLWSLCCAYLAIKTSFGLPVAKAFWATLATWILSLIPFFLVSGIFVTIVGVVQAILSGLGL